MIFLVFLLLLVSAAVGLARAVSLDGLGTRPGPRSHHDPLPRQPTG
jgi:hypothetical protein